MRTSGVSVKSVTEFINSKYGEESLQKWLASLPDKSRELFTSTILVSSWYDIFDALINPTIKLCDMFYGGKIDGAFDQGRYSAGVALSGVYKVFVKLGSPDFIISKASTILPKYYENSVMKVVEKEKKNLLIRIEKFETPHEIVENRIKGWMTKALEVSGASNPTVQIASSMAAGDQFTDFRIHMQ